MAEQPEPAESIESTEQPGGVRARMRASKVGTLLPLIVAVLAIALAVLVISSNRRQLDNAVDQLGWKTSGLALLVGIAGVFVIVFVWRAVLDGLGAHTALLPASRVFFISQLGKYLPGSIWPVVAQMEFGRRQGIARRTMLAANVITIALSFTVALLLAAVLLPLSSTAALHRFWWTFLLLPPLLACLHPNVIPAALNFLLRALHREELTERLPARSVFVAIAWSAVSWLLLGLHLWIITHALGAHGASGFAAAVGGAAFAVAVGIAFIPAPAGAGVRDTVLVLSLSPSLGATVALAAALASRVLLVVADVVLAGAAALARRRPGNRDQ